MKKQKLVLLILICLNLAFIWGNSMLSGANSTKVSNVVTGAVEKVIDSVSSAETNRENTPSAPLEPTETEAQTDEAREYFEYILSIVVRKCAHMFEFFVLAVLLSLILEKKYQTILLCGVFTALIDETIQLSNDRSSSVKDVWIDTIGFAVGMLCILLIKTIRSKKQDHIT